MFSKIDLRFDYHDVSIKDEDIYKISSRTRYGQYKFVVIPFKFMNELATFTCLMNSILSKYLDKFVLVFIDDIMICSKVEEEHEEHLKIVLQILREHKLYSKYNKCGFYRKTYAILRGHYL